MQEYNFFASCPVYLEELLQKELIGLGATNTSVAHGGVAFSGIKKTAYSVCLWSRIANRLFLPLVSFQISSPYDIKKEAECFNWEDHFNILSKLSIDATLSKTKICTADYAALCVKDGIVDRARKLRGNRPQIDSKNPDVRIHIHISTKYAEISLDLSGGGLHKRGYRTETVRAAVRENVAAAVLQRASWSRDLFDNKTCAYFLDPMCGSGTFVVEAAMMAADVAPALDRNFFGFFNWNEHDENLWVDIKNEAEIRASEGIKRLEDISKERGLSSLFEGRDIDARAVVVARNNIKLSRLATLYKKGLIRFESDNFFEASAPLVEDSKIDKFLVTNPPYGERLNRQDDMIEFYLNIGTTLKKSYSGWRAIVLAGSNELSDAINLRADKINTIYNGGIRCALVHFRIFNEKGAKNKVDKQKNIEIPGYSNLSPGSQMLYNRLKKNARKLKGWLAKSNIQCYRLYDADMPEYSVAVDIYPPEVVIQEYAPPKTIDKIAASKRFREAVLAVQAWLGIPRENIKIKTRQKQRGSSQYNKYKNSILRQKERRIIKENNLRFLVDTESYLDTGIFLDSRPIRGFIKNEASKRSFLNLFCYTGTASVYAAAGGAVSVTFVDTSATYLEWAKMNMKINGYEKIEQNYVKSDCIGWLKTAIGNSDLIYLDPPTFSNSKDRDEVFDLQKDHENLIRLAISRLTQDGKLIFCNNFKRFKMSQALLDEFIIKDITELTLDPDFNRKKIHRCWMITK